MQPSPVRGRFRTANRNRPEPGAEQSAETRQRGRGKGDVVALTVRLPRAEWERVHQLAVSEGVSIQSLAVDGLSKVFAEKGLPTLSV
ncbi:hypothetical protein J4732_15465 [Serratia marcescens]|uniref:Uncharacterized protein n=1 Tax=Serratia marcescens TaxID=615 RepID=A0A939SUS9_SERMA|nr:hypothetical protein [Serratia marcescens]MBO2007090.1 hypothetical protein [Serratia marcescens]